MLFFTENPVVRGFFAALTAAVFLAGNYQTVSAQDKIMSDKHPRWQITFTKGLSFEDARKLSLPDTELPGAIPLVLKDDFADIGKLTPGFVPAETTAVARYVFNMPESGKLIISAGADWWFHGFINGTPFGDTEANGNAAHPISAMDQIYVVDVVKGENIITFHLRAGNSWHFGVKIMPLPGAWPQDYRIMKRLITKVLESSVRPVYPPTVFNISRNSADVTVEFSIPVLCGIRFAPAKGGEKITQWNTVYGQRDYQQINHFSLKGLQPDTEYVCEILRHDETTARETVEASVRFTTTPASGQKHRLMVFSDVQFPTAKKHQIIKEFISNTPLAQADAIVALGDMASGFGNFTQAYFTDFTEILRAKNVLKPLYFIRGNHELWGEESGLYSRFFGRPYGAFTHGDILYIMLDTGEDQPRQMLPLNRTQKSEFKEYYAEQSAWLRELVNSPVCRNAKKRIVLAHTPPFEFNDRFMAKNISSMVKELFYGKNPLCRIDLWVAGHIHYPLRYDPAAGKLHGGKLKRPVALTENDIRNVHFPVYVNDGPGGSISYASVLDIVTCEESITVRCFLPDGTCADESVIRSGKPFEVKSTMFEELWSR